MGICAAGVGQEAPMEGDFVAAVHGAEQQERVRNHGCARCLGDFLLSDQVCFVDDGGDAGHRSILPAPGNRHQHAILPFGFWLNLVEVVGGDGDGD